MYVHETTSMGTGVTIDFSIGRNDIYQVEESLPSWRKIWSNNVSTNAMA